MRKNSSIFSLPATPRRERRCPKGKGEKLILERMEITLQKMEMPKQTR
jgi:hypothetical protein